MVSNKEIEAALSAFLAEYCDSSAEWWHYRKEVIAALEAAARVRAEDNAGEPVGEITQECRYCANTGWFYGDPGLETFCGCSFGEVRKDASGPSPQPSGTVEAQLSPVWLQNLIGFLDGVFPDDAAWRATWLKQLRALALTAGKPEQECATEGCDKPATDYFERGGVGSHYCHGCYLKVQAVTTLTAGGGDE